MKVTCVSRGKRVVFFGLSERGIVGGGLGSGRGTMQRATGKRSGVEGALVIAAKWQCVVCVSATRAGAPCDRSALGAPCTLELCQRRRLWTATRLRRCLRDSPDSTQSKLWGLRGPRGHEHSIRSFLQSQGHAPAKRHAPHHTLTPTPSQSPTVSVAANRQTCTGRHINWPLAGVTRPAR